MFALVLTVLGLKYVNKYKRLKGAYSELRAQREAYIDNVVERIAVNESALVKRKTLLNTSLNELEVLAATSGAPSWEMAANKQRKIVSLVKDGNSRKPDLGTERIGSITRQIREQIYNYIPDDKSHLGGTVQRLDDFIDFVKMSVAKYKLKKGFEIQLRIQVSDVKPEVYLFHDQDFIVRWFIFLSMFVKDENILRAPPALEITITPGEHPFSYNIRTAFVLYKSDVLPQDFNLQYAFYFHTGMMPDEWASMSPYLIEALKMSSVYSVVVNKENNDKFGNTTLYFERGCYVSKSRTDFDTVVSLRRKYPASKLFYVSAGKKDYENQHLEELLTDMGLMLADLPFTDFSPSLLSRTRIVFISSSIPPEGQAKIVMQTLASPFTKVKLCIIGNKEPLQLQEHANINFIEMPLSRDKIESVL